MRIKPKYSVANLKELPRYLAHGRRCSKCDTLLLPRLKAGKLEVISRFLNRYTCGAVACSGATGISMQECFQASTAQHGNLYNAEQIKALDTIGIAWTRKQIDWDTACNLRELVKAKRCGEALDSLNIVERRAA